MASPRARAACSAALGVLALLLVLPLPSVLGTTLAYTSQTVTVVAACAAMGLRARRGDRALRRPRVLVMLSMLAAALGGVLATVLVLVTGEAPAGLSLDDVAHFCFLPLAVAGLLSFPVRDSEAGSAARSLLDGLLAAATLWFVVFALVLEPYEVAVGLPSAEAAVALAYPATDVLILAMCASVLPRVTASAQRELALICGGLALYGLSDIAYAALASAGSYEPASWVGVLAEAGLLLLLVGALTDGREVARRPRLNRACAALPLLPLVPALGIASWMAWNGTPLGPAQSGVALVITVLLVLRQLVGSRDRMALVERLQVREELFRSLVTGSSDLIALYGADGTVRYASPAVSETMGLAESEVTRETVRAAIHPDDRGALRSASRLALQVQDGRAEVAVRVRCAGGQWRWHHIRLRNALHEPAVRGLVSNSRDVHERHLLELKVQHAATHDALTGLGNLARARALLDEVCAAPGAPATVMLVDLDGFKAVNDTFGHADGDALLMDVAARLLTCVRAEDHVTRIGGDEFLLVLPGGGGAADGASVADRVLAALRRPVVVAGRALTTGASLGVASTQDAATPEELLRNADLAMYAAKAAGRGRAVWYETRMHDSAARRMQVQRGLRRALDDVRDDMLALHYQPIVRLPHGQVTGLEALLRWVDPDLGPIGPDVFIPIAEECGLMGEIDAWVLERACEDLVAWGASAVPVSINISRQHLTDDLPGLVAGALARHGLAPELLCLEITESAVVPDPEKALAVLQAVRAGGVRIALDDFGTGQSSLSQLARLPIDTVKIDKSFVLDSTRDAGARRLLTSIIGVCSSLGMPVVAEGIEEVSLVASLHAGGCAFGQGYHFGRPAPATSVPALLRKAIPAQRLSLDGPVLSDR